LVKPNQAIVKVTTDIEDRFHFNTALAAIMELNNEITAARSAQGGEQNLSTSEAGRLVLAVAVENLVRLLEPFAPHMCAELWELLGRERIWNQGWPECDERFLAHDVVEIAVQVNGKVRERVEVPREAEEAEVLAQVKSLPAVEKHLTGKRVVKEIVVPGKLVNLVVR
jgi:leucyl-tRNA synthetase